MAGVVFTLAARGDIRGLVFPTPLPHTLVSFSPDPLGAPGRYIPAGQQRLTVGFFFHADRMVVWRLVWHRKRAGT